MTGYGGERRPAGSEAQATEARAAVAAHWAASVMGTSFVPLSVTEARSLTGGFVDDLTSLAHAETFDPTPARAVGLALVAAHLTNPVALSRTVSALLAAPDVITGRARYGPDRWDRLVAAVAEGYAVGLRDKVLRDQQEILEAAFQARDEAEGARWKAESARWDAERALERTREDFIATVSHELRTPLTPLKGYLHMLRTHGGDIPAEQRQEFYRVMLSQTDLLEHLADDLRAATHASEAQFSVNLGRVDIPTLVKEAMDAVDPASRREFRWRGSAAAGEAIGDPVRLRQVLSALLRNADLYATPGTPVDLSATRDDSWVEVVVRDFGPGIAPDLVTAAFEPFRRLGQGASPGSGLGLHIARRLVEAMHGRIWHTDAEPGSAFHLMVPSAP